VLTAGIQVFLLVTEISRLQSDKLSINLKTCGSIVLFFKQLDFYLYCAILLQIILKLEVINLARVLWFQKWKESSS
jgi:hypothetical protein